MKHKKILSIMIAMTVMASMSACSSDDDDNETTGALSEQNTTAEITETDERSEVSETEEEAETEVPDVNEDQTMPDTTTSTVATPDPASQQGIICYGEANDENAKIYPLMGREHWGVEDAGVNDIGHHSWKYVDLDTGVVLGECFGYCDTPDAYIVDIDEDGVYELLCNVQYGADMACRALVFRDNNGKLEQGDFDSYVYEDATGSELWGAAYYDIVYEPNSNALYIIDNGNESRYEISLKYYVFYDYEYWE